jgi:hypothetical protein
MARGDGVWGDTRIRNNALGGGRTRDVYKKGESRIAMEDDAVACLDEGVRPRCVRRRMPIAYRAAEGKRHECELGNPLMAR